MNKLKAIGAGVLAAGSIFCFSAAWNNSVARAVEDRSDRPHLDLAFCIDTTGSMGGEIEIVKKKTKELVAKLASGKPAPVVRVGLVAFRDRGDEYVTKVYPFSEDIDKVVKDISDLRADGGGDALEALNQALHASLHDLHWTENKKASKLLFVIGDAGPKNYPNDYNWETETKQAISRGIQINTIACDGLDSLGNSVFQRIAKLADGKFETLAYRQEVVNAAGEKETLITSGGATYRLKKGAESEWKAGASELAAKGLADKVTASAAPASPGRLRSYLGGPRLSGATSGTIVPAATGGAEFADSASLGAVAERAADRRDSNLDELMLNLAKAKMKKDSAVEYKK
ncbi:MAG TPA: vWA domain-containing protein [Candidatus Obscuribacterales bacterium]